MADRFTVHDTFVIEHTYNVPPAKVFAALSSAAAKSNWFGADEGNALAPLEMDFRVGGQEKFTAQHGGTVYKYLATYQNIVPGQRIVSTYNMWLNDELMSVSVATVDLTPAGNVTKLTYTEQGVYLDGLDKPADRLHGTKEILKSLGEYVEIADEAKG
ncbi:MAG: SRPBCC domain-containing protein [Candidatus Eremiobacteraeota bacterium]|nr:SRPBCC domain-containing protein [Candidatus Eremiobacteraeota bacterium]